MARGRGRPGVLQRQRERKKAEKAELKRAQRAERSRGAEGEGAPVADQDDLAGYGVLPEPDTRNDGRD